MTRPDILTRIDELLVTHYAEGIRAFANGTIMSEVLTYLDRLDEFSQRRWVYEGVTISLVSQGGWGAHTPVPGFERPIEPEPEPAPDFASELHPRDPDTGQFVARED